MGAFHFFVSVPHLEEEVAVGMTPGRTVLVPTESAHQNHMVVLIKPHWTFSTTLNKKMEM